MGNEELEELRKIRKANEKIAEATIKMEKRNRPLRKFARKGLKNSENSIIVHI